MRRAYVRKRAGARPVAAPGGSLGGYNPLLASFSAIAEALTSGGDLGAVLQSIAEEALRLLHATSARIRIPDASGAQLLLAAVADDAGAGTHMPSPDFATPIATDPIAGEPFRTGQIRVARGAPRRGISGAQHALYCAVPLLIRSRVHGVLIIWRTTDAPFSEADVAIARVFGNATALAIEEVRLLTEERDRTHELATLLDVTRNVASTLELEPLLGLILDQLKSVVEYTSAGILTEHDPGEWVQVEYRGPLPRERGVGIRRRGRPSHLFSDMIRSGKPVVIADVRDDTPFAAHYREFVGEEMLRTNLSFVRAWMGIPLVVNDQVVGAMNCTHHEPGYFTPRHVELASAIATQAAVAIQNAKLYEAERHIAERTRELATLLEVSRNVAATLDLQPLLGLILDQLKTVVDYTSALVVTIEGDEFVQVEYRGWAPRGRTVGIRMPSVAAARAGPLWEMFRTLRPVIIPDLWADTALTRAYRAIIGEERFRTADNDNHSWMGVPLVVNERNIGLLALNHIATDFYSAHDAELTTAIATHAAIAIENARLYAESKAYSVLQERARLARELHDSVTQVLFSMTLHARTTLRQLERAGGDPDDPTQRSVRVLSELAQGALAEMRMLIFELRPGALADEGLVGALRKLAAASSAREGIAIEVDAPTARLPLDAAAEEQLYRLTQEALNNAIAHAQARRVTIRVRGADDDGAAFLLAITDDGIGFDTDGAHPGHMGLGTMAERAQAVGGACTITSAPGSGTTVRVVIPSVVPVG